jgi:hypothetical protein
MSVTFTKLFSSITASTVWCEPDQTRIAWIAMLAMADRKGRVWGSIPGFASIARIPVDAARLAIATFLAPDKDSRTKEHEGRRIEEIDGGWVLLNYEKHRSVVDEESVRETKRKYINARRAKERDTNLTVDKNVYSRHRSIQAEEEAEEEEEQVKVKTNTPPPAPQGGSASADAPATSPSSAGGVTIPLPLPERRANKPKPPVVFIPDGVQPQTWTDWCELRRAKKAPVTPTVVANATKEAAKAGMSLDAFLQVWCARGSQGLQADWLKSQQAGYPQGNGETAYQRNMRLRVHEMTGGLVSSRAPDPWAETVPPVILDMLYEETTDVTAKRLG